jgi:hypothetical protein
VDNCKNQHHAKGYCKKHYSRLVYEKKPEIIKRNQEYRERNKQLKSEYDREYREKNQSKIKENKKNHYESNKPEILLKQRIAHQKNKEHRNKKVREYQAIHKEEIAKRGKIRRDNPEHKKKKAEYDREYRKKNLEIIVKKKREHYQIPEVKARKKKYQEKYYKTPEGIESKKRGQKSWFLKNVNPSDRDRELEKVKTFYKIDANGQCEWYGCENKQVHANHILLLSKYDDLKYEKRNLIAYCPHHHWLFHFLHWKYSKRNEHRNPTNFMKGHVVNYNNSVNFIDFIYELIDTHSNLKRVLNYVLNNLDKFI